MDLSSDRGPDGNGVGGGLKYTAGFTKLWPSLWTWRIYDQFLFSFPGLEDHSIGTGYAVWTGIGAVGTAILGIVLFGESHSVTRILCIAMIVAGIAGLRLASPG